MAAIVATVAYLSAKSHYLETGEASARAIVLAVQQTLSVGVYARDEVLLKEMIDGMARHPSVARVSVRDAANNALITSTANGAMAQDSIASPGTASFESLLVSPFNADETIGHLQVWLDSTRLAAEARRQASILVGALIVLMAGISTVFNILASRLLSRPMHRLAETLERLQPGSFERLALAPRHMHDEVGIVTVAANRLLDLQQRALEREWAMREELSALEARYRGIFDSTSAGIFILSTTGVLLQANPALSRLLKKPANEFNTTQTANFAKTAFAVPEQLLKLVQSAQASALPEAADLELLRSDGGTLWVHCMVSAVFDAMSGEDRIEGVLYDITRRKQQENAAQHRAEHDALTGLKSRAFIESSLGEHVHTAGRNDGAVTLMFIDLDGFKAVNDRWGHAAGDAVLVEAAHRLQALFQRSCDTIGRLGGDELVVMIVGVEATHPSVALMATNLIDSFKATFALPNGETAVIGASVGVASYPLHATNSQTLIHAADAAMYTVKQSGRGRFVIAQPNDAIIKVTQELMLEQEPKLGNGDAWVPTRTEHAANTGIDDGLRSDPPTGLMDCIDAVCAREQIA
ncbi:MAG: diguanylate cyclase [Pseudomonas sp.]|nr:MAG: diguanylate cyclase [Pseudomonas sp.]